MVFCRKTRTFIEIILAKLDRVFDRLYNLDIKKIQISIGKAMNIHPRPDQELAILEVMKMGLIQNEVDILDIGLNTLLKNNTTEPQIDVATRLSRFGKEHNLSTGGSTIKDMINEGRL